MELIGKLDSPFVRRVAISLRLLEIEYTLQQVSVYSAYEEFKALNPVVKAPTLVCDDGVTLMDSNLIIDYLEHLAGKSLMPDGAAERRRALRLIGLALTASEKVNQVAQEVQLRPKERQHEPWAARVMEQLVAAVTLLDDELARHPFGGILDQASLTTAAAWGFIQLYLAETMTAAAFPALAAHAAWAERHPVFEATRPGSA
jgi:glutathione S-transferase